MPAAGLNDKSLVKQAINDPGDRRLGKTGLPGDLGS
jgi:hypothetical protein